MCRRKFSLFQSLKKKIGFLFQVIPAGGDGGFFWSLGGSSSPTAGMVGQWASLRHCAMGSWVTSLVKFSDMETENV